MPTTEAPLGCTGCALKLFVGTLFVCSLSGVVLWASDHVSWIATRPWVLMIIGGATLVLGIELATSVLAKNESTPFGILGAHGLLDRKDRSVAACLSRGEAVADEFRIERAIFVEADLSSGCAFFCQLEAGGVLLLQGQYLYDYIPFDVEDVLEEEQVPRRFPCRKFATIRALPGGSLMAISAREGVFEPEAIFPEFTTELLKSLNDQIPDGQVWPDVSLDQIIELLES